MLARNSKRLIKTSSAQPQTILKEMDVNLKDHFKLLHSGDESGPIVLPSNTERKRICTDYAALISATSGFYPSKSTRMSDIESFERTLPAAIRNTWSDPTTYSVSDTLSDSGSDYINNQVPSFSPLLEDSLDPSSKQAKKRTKTTVNPSNDVSSISNAITMTEILQLSKTARYDNHSHNNNLLCT